MRKYDALINQYFEQCLVRGIGQGTINTRRREVERFGSWVKRKKPKPMLEEVNLEIIVDYLKSQSVFKSKATVYGKISNLRCFFDFLVEENIWRKNPLKWFKGPKLHVDSHIPKSLKKPDIEKLLQSCFESKISLHQYLLPTVFLCLYSLGLRRGELVSLNLHDWNNEERTLIVRNSKSGFERYMPVPKALERSLEAYLTARTNLLIEKGRPQEHALFISCDGFRITGHAISTHLQRRAKSIGISHFSVHQLRHTCATQLLNSGVSVPEVKMVLGHAAIETTLRYTHVAGPDRWEAIKKHPLNTFLSEQGVVHAQ